MFIATPQMLSLSLLLHPSPHPFSPLFYSFYLCTESAFQSSMPQACREPDHGVNYTPTDTRSLPCPPPVLLHPTSLSLSQKCFYKIVQKYNYLKLQYLTINDLVPSFFIITSYYRIF